MLTPLRTLASLNPYGNPYPLLNVPVNPKGETYLHPNLLTMGDLGSAYFNLDKTDQVLWSADCGRPLDHNALNTPPQPT